MNHNIKKKIIYTRQDGGLSVVHPVISSEDLGMTEDQAVSRAWLQLPKDAIKPRIIDESELPSDRKSRNAWEDAGKTIEINPLKVTAQRSS